MNYDIKISGDKNLLRIDDGDKLRKKWENYLEGGSDEVVDIKDWIGKLSDIKYFRKAPSVKSEDNKTPQEVHDQYLLILNEKRNQTIEERSKNLGFFRLVYYGFTNQRSENVKINGKPIEDLIINIQRKFFERNPKRIVCDPFIYKPLIKSNNCLPSIMGIIETHVRQDSYAEKFIK